MIDDNGTYTLPKSFKELKEELGNKYDKYMYDMNLELLKEMQKYKSAYDELVKYLFDTEILEFNSTKNKFLGLENSLSHIESKIQELEQKYSLGGKE